MQKQLGIYESKREKPGGESQLKRKDGGTELVIFVGLF